MEGPPQHNEALWSGDPYARCQLGEPLRAPQHPTCDLRERLEQKKGRRVSVNRCGGLTWNGEVGDWKNLQQRSTVIRGCSAKERVEWPPRNEEAEHHASGSYMRFV